jgi:hypothetical protein
MTELELHVAQVAAEERFASEFRVSAKGNLWRRYDNLLLSVFRSRWGGWSWCISEEGEEPEFSKGRFKSQEEAISDLFRRVWE